MVIENILYDLHTKKTTLQHHLKGSKNVLSPYVSFQRLLGSLRYLNYM